MNHPYDRRLVLCASGIACLLTTTTVCSQQESEGLAQNALPDLMVTGKRASLIDARSIRRERIAIVDAIVAEEIGKLPDHNVTDALSRVSGIQVQQDRGEGAGLTIRGLTQMATTLNGRETFTAGTARTLDMADVPSEMLAAIEVHKTASADRVEGGIGGDIDLRTYRPFDLPADKLGGSVRWMYGDRVHRSEPQVSMLASSRWQHDTLGEFGLLLDVAYQRRAWREDQQSAGNPVLHSDIVPGQNVVVPNGTSETTSAGQCERKGINAVMQWRPSPALELYAEGSLVELNTRQDSYQFNVAGSSTFAPGSAVLYPGTSNLQQIHWTNAPISVLSFARDTQDRTQQYALGGQWQEGARKLRADVSRTRSHNNLFFAGTILKATAPDAWQRASDAGISSTVSGISLLDPANFNYAGLMYRVRPYDGAATAATLDGEYLVGGALLDRWSAGLRLARREADNGLGLIFGDATLNNIAAGSMPGYTSGLPFGNGFFPGGPFVVSHAEAARDPAQMYTDFGIASPLPQQGSALGRWRIDEQTVAAYLMADFHALDAGLDANAGMRVVQTREQVAGNRNDPVAGTVLPLAVDNRYVDYLPSVNLRYAWNEAWQMRGALSRTITRPAFDQLSPSLNLVRNSVTPSLNQGSAGNPELKPIRASNLDVALEHYFGEDGALTATGFYKRVDGFIANASAPESYGGETYQVSRPYNSLPADIRGAEVSYQQFYRDWPGWLGGLGLNATYTYIDSSTPNSVLGTSTPLPNLSRNSYNLVGMYERGAHSARLAYNWRGRFMSRVASFVGLPPTPVYMYSYAWLDAAYSYRMSKQATLTLEGNNLLRTVRRSYYGDVSRPESIYYNDRRFSLVLILSQ